jgi:hypothetical protein
MSIYGCLYKATSFFIHNILRKLDGYLTQPIPSNDIHLSLQFFQIFLIEFFSEPTNASQNLFLTYYFIAIR